MARKQWRRINLNGVSNGVAAWQWRMSVCISAWRSADTISVWRNVFVWRGDMWLRSNKRMARNNPSKY